MWTVGSSFPVQVHSKYLHEVTNNPTLQHRINHLALLSGGNKANILSQLIKKLQSNKTEADPIQSI